MSEFGPGGGAVLYVALGDSYTIGTGASSAEASFPRRLARRLEVAGGRAVEVRNPAVNGYTTGDLIREELPLLDGDRPNLVSVLIGANDIVQGADTASYQRALVVIYDAVRRRVSSPEAVIAVSVPDWSVVPAVASYGRPANIALRVSEFNAIAAEEALARGFAFVDITEQSRRNEPGWISEDRLHPGDRQYEAWADSIWSSIGPTWLALLSRVTST